MVAASLAAQLAVPTVARAHLEESVGVELEDSGYVWEELHEDQCRLDKYKDVKLVETSPAIKITGDVLQTDELVESDDDADVRKVFLQCDLELHIGPFRFARTAEDADLFGNVLAFYRHPDTVTNVSDKVIPFEEVVTMDEIAQHATGPSKKTWRYTRAFKYRPLSNWPTTVTSKAVSGGGKLSLYVPDLRDDRPTQPNKFSIGPQLTFSLDTRKVHAFLTSDYPYQQRLSRDLVGYATEAYTAGKYVKGSVLADDEIKGFVFFASLYLGEVIWRRTRNVGRERDFETSKYDHQLMIREMKEGSHDDVGGLYFYYRMMRNRVVELDADSDDTAELLAFHDGLRQMLLAVVEKTTSAGLIDRTQLKDLQEDHQKLARAYVTYLEAQEASVAKFAYGPARWFDSEVYGNINKRGRPSPITPVCDSGNRYIFLEERGLDLDITHPEVLVNTDSVKGVLEQIRALPTLATGKGHEEKAKIAIAITKSVVDWLRKFHTAQLSAGVISRPRPPRWAVDTPCSIQ